MHSTPALLLFTSAFTLRFRFKYHHPLFLFLRNPVIPQTIICPLVVIDIVSVLYNIHLTNNAEIFYFITSLIFIPTGSLYLSFMNMKNSEAGLLLTAFTHLRLDIEPGYIPDNLSEQAYRNVLIKFIDSIITLQNLPFTAIHFGSHLITPRIKKYLEDNLNERGIPFHCKTRKTWWPEVAVLNLRYGGLTRYRLLSHKRHANGFRVRRTGYTFTIKRKCSKSVHSQVPKG